MEHQNNTNLEEETTSFQTIHNPNQKQKKDWHKRLYHKGWDIGLALFLLGSSCYFFYRLYTLSFFSFDWMWKIAALLIAINLLFCLLLIIKRFPNWAVWIRRFIIILLCGVLTYGGVFVNNVQLALEAVTQPETATTINVSLITKEDGGARTLSELSGKKIGLQSANDKANSSYVKEQLDKESELSNVTYVEELNYDTLYENLQKGEIDALIITDYYFKTLLKESNPTIEDDIFILKSYQKKKETTINTSTKDIRYEPFTVYIAGVDEGDDPSIDARSDVNIILMVNPLANHIEMVSIPRDSFVPNPALGFANDKLTHLGLSGIENSMQGIQEVFGFEIDFYVKLNFYSVIDIVDALGEIEVDVPVEFCEQDENRSFAEEDLICLKEGTQKLNGKQTLAFARHRKSYTDVMRGKAQLEIIEGIINLLTSPSGVANINEVLSIASKTVSTNMPMDQVTNFVSMQLDNIKPWSINSISLENGVDASLITASIPNQELYVMLLNQLDVQEAFDVFQQMVNQMQFSSFTFHLDQLEADKQELPSNPNVLWAGSYVGDYKISDQQPEATPVEEPEYIPPSNTPPEQPSNEPSIPEETPVVPEKPVIPETPVEPDTPDASGESDGSTTKPNDPSNTTDTPSQNGTQTDSNNQATQ